jgi:hypothetical protein
MRPRSRYCVYLDESGCDRCRMLEQSFAHEKPSLGAGISSSHLRAVIYGTVVMHFAKSGGPTRNRTGVRGFAVLYVTTPPSGLMRWKRALRVGARYVKRFGAVWSLWRDRKTATAFGFDRSTQPLCCCTRGEWSRLKPGDRSGFNKIGLKPAQS